MNDEKSQTSILLSAIAADVFEEHSELVAKLANRSYAAEIAKSLNKPKLVRELRRKRHFESDNSSKIDPHPQGDRVKYQDRDIGKIQILYKASLPGELQAKLASESAIDRFLEYLQKRHQIVVLNESDFHVQVFIPKTRETLNFDSLWRDFLETVAFSTYGDNKHNLPGLTHTFINPLNTVTLAGRGFSTLDVPVVNKEQSNVLGAWYFAVFKAVEKRQLDRRKKIKKLQDEIAKLDSDSKEYESKEKELAKAEEMDKKENAEKYSKYFPKLFDKVLKQQKKNWQELEQIQNKLKEEGLKKTQINKLKKQQDKLTSQILFSKDSVDRKLELLEESQGDPFEFIKSDRATNPELFKEISEISKRFNKTATDQINATRGDIFSQCILEMYRLLENEPKDPLPEPLLSEKKPIMVMRNPGDDGKDFCYSCGVSIDSKTAKWQVARFMFERPSQRLQSSPSEKRPIICANCSVLSFISPLKVSEENIIVKLESKDKKESKFSIREYQREYLRMLTNKDIHLCSGKYISLRSDRTQKGDLASQKLGQVQFALAKIAEIFPLEVLKDFQFSLIPQGSKPKVLENRHLVYIKGLMEGYKQSIILSGKEINSKLGDAIRYVEQDLPILAEYTLVRVSEICNQLLLEQIRDRYMKLNQNTDNKKAKLYRDTAALTGITYAFAQSLESTIRQTRKPEEVEREVSKLIEQVNDPIAFGYYLTLGDENKRSVQARLYSYPSNYYIFKETKTLLKNFGISEEERKGEDKEKQQTWLQLYADDILNAYEYFANHGYSQDKEFKELTYNVKLSLYTRFPYLVRKL